ncbi:hypothetical protein B6U99_06375 [Candidatus Geothermarchaeota archaeon ex4572_27]|nr:MAG: hypothetical protein B6U99_06375 [Candidatus Geothermarchaeota archaeon ex4572_27]
MQARLAFIRRGSSMGMLYVAFDSLDEFKDASRQLIWSLRVCVERPEGSVEQLGRLTASMSLRTRRGSLYGA